MPITRRGVQISLGALWILDGALQLQPAMLTERFARGVIAGASVGQPSPVRWLVSAAASVMSAAPVAFDVCVGAIQILLGVALLVRKSARLGLGLSVLWSGGVWAFGEGFGGIFGPGATILSGAPGAALFYAVLALSAWPPRDRRADATRPASWLPLAWAATWGGFALLELLPGRGSGTAISASLTSNLSGLPPRFVDAAHALAGLVRHEGSGPGLVLVLVFLLVALAGLRPGVSRVSAGLIGAAVAIVTWALAEGFGGIATGLATDPNTGPLLILLAATVCSAAPAADRVASRGRSDETSPVASSSAIAV